MNTINKRGKDYFIVVDVETSGPNPSNYALLSIGACTISDPRETFYIELKPDAKIFDPEAMEVHKLSLDELLNTGNPPEDAFEKFSSWVKQIIPDGYSPVFVAFNAPFDWMFVNDYFHRYLGYNPFGHKALDIKALYMGLNRTEWSETSFLEIILKYGIETRLPHHALEDAMQQAKIFDILLDEIRGEHHDEIE